MEQKKNLKAKIYDWGKDVADGRYCIYFNLAERNMKGFYLPCNLVRNYEDEVVGLRLFDWGELKKGTPVRVLGRNITDSAHEQLRLYARKLEVEFNGGRAVQ